MKRIWLNALAASMAIISSIGKSKALLFLLAFTAVSCSDLVVFMPKNQASSFSGIDNVEINEDGQLAMAWKSTSQSKTINYNIYLYEVEDGDKNLVFSSKAQFKAPLTYETLTVASIESPVKKGKLLESVKDLSFVLSDLLEVGKTYAIQVTDRKKTDPKGEEKALLVRIDFPRIDAGSAKPIDGFIDLQWDVVAGANRYEVYADIEMTILLGQSNTNRLTLKTSANAPITDFYIKALRGQLGDKNAIIISLDQSSVKVVKVAAQTIDGVYKAGDILSIDVEFTEAVKVDGSVSLPLNMGDVVRYASLASGNNNKFFNFQYEVLAGDNTLDLSTGTYLKGNILDRLNLKLNTALPVSGATSLKDSSSIDVDTKAPTLASSIGFGSASSNSGNISVSWTAGSDAHFSLNKHEVMVCNSSSCSGSCSTATQTNSSSASLTAIPEGAYYACVRGEDDVGNISAWASSLGSVRVDTTSPGVVYVSAISSNGTYATGASLSFAVVFDEPLFVTGTDLRLTLASGSTAHDAVYASGSGTSTLIFSYTVQSGDQSADLDYNDVNSLYFTASGSLADAAGNAALRTLPALASANSLKGRSNIVIDTTPPAAPSISSPLNNSFNASIASVSGTAEAGSIVEVKAGASVIGNVTVDGSGNWALTLGSALSDGPHSLTATAKDGAGNVSVASSSVTATLDTIKPTAVAGISFDPAHTNSTAFDVQWTTAATDANFQTHEIKLCTSNNTCSVACLGTSNALSSPASLTGASVGVAYYACVRAVDKAGNLSDWVSSVSTLIVDQTAPHVVTVSSDKADAAYTVGEEILIQATFDEAVVVADDASLGIQVETGITDRLAVYESGSGTKIINFKYTVKAGDASLDLEYTGTNALAVGAGSIKDLAGNNANLTLPALGSSESLGGSKAIIIDTNIPPAPHITSPVDNSHVKTDIAIVSGTSEANASIEVKEGSTIVGSTTADGSGNWSLTLSSAYDEGTYAFSATAENISGNKSARSSVADVVVDKTLPSVPGAVTLNSAYSSTASFAVNWASNSTDSYFSTHNVKACALNDCSTSCTSITTANVSPGSVTGVNGNSYYACVQGLDLAGNTSAWVVSTASITVDSTAPAAPLITSPLHNSYSTSNLTTISGTAENNAKVEVKNGVTSIGIATADVSGNWTLTLGSALSDGTYSLTATAEDSAGNVGAASSAISTKVDTINPTNPAGAGFSSAYSNTTGFNVQWSTLSSDTNFSTHNVKICAANNCSTSCISATTSTSSPAAVTGVNGSSYYACVQGLDLAGRLSDWIASATTLTVDTSAPAAPVITSPLHNSYPSSNLATISGTSEASAKIVVKNGVSTVGNTTADGSGNWTLSLGTALTNGVYNLTATAEDAAGNVSAASSTVKTTVDTINPTNPVSVGFSSTHSTSTSFNVQWGTNSTDTNFNTHNVKICTATDCSTGCISAATGANSPVSVTGVNGGIYYACVQGSDLAGRSSSWVNSVTSLTVDTTIPKVNSVSSSNSNGSYKAPTDIFIQITFDEAIYVTNDASLGLTLETGTTDRLAVYSSGSGSAIITFKYTVQTGDSSSNLEYVNTSSLSAGSGAFKDIAGNNALLTLPALNSAQSLGGSKAIVIDAIAPAAPAFTSPLNGASLNTPITSLQGTGEPNAMVELFQDASSLGSVAINGSGVWTKSLSPSVVNDGNYSFSAKVTDAVGNVGTTTTINVSLSIPAATANAGSDIIVPASATLLGNVSNANGVQWTQVSGTGTITFGTATAATTTVSANADGIYVLRLTATNIGGFSVYDEMIFTRDSTAPTLNGVLTIKQTVSTAAHVYWEGAVDNLTAATDISYELCYSASVGGCASGSFSGTILPFDSSHWERNLTGLTANTAYEVNIRASDLAGNVSYGTARYTNGAAVTQLATRDRSACALLTNGTVRCWGLNNNGQLGYPTASSVRSHSPVTVSGLSGVKSIGAGSNHFCAIMSDDSVKCWGNNGNGQLGNGTTGGTSSTPVSVSGVSNAIALAGGGLHMCAVLSGGGVKCWGRNDQGQLGNTTTNDSNVAVDVSGISDAIAIASGDHFTCAQKANKTLVCWGRNNYGQLGDNSTNNRLSAVAVNGSDAVKHFALGEAFGCLIVDSTAAVKCWGYGGHGNLGRGSGAQSNVPVAATGMTSDAVSLLAGWKHACALMSDNTSRCWGDNVAGQFGDGTLTGSNVPVAGSNIGSLQKVAGGYYQACGVTSDGLVKCWGEDVDGVIGDGSSSQRRSPVEIQGLASTPTALDAGIDHSCALLTNETVACWGNNRDGQLGSGLFNTENVSYANPRAIAGLTQIKSIAVGSYHSCAVNSVGSVYCWGRNVEGQLGNNGATGNTASLQTVVSTSGSGMLSGAESLASSENTTCAVLSDGSMQCWGNGAYGKLGNSSTSNSSIPVLASVFNGKSIKQAAIGTEHICVLLNTGAVECLGRSNNHRQLGVDTTNRTTSSVQVLTGVLSIDSYKNHTCALKNDKTIWCWGRNDLGQLGNGGTANGIPTQVFGINNAKAVKVGEDFTCAALEDNALKCWGEDDEGRLGNGSLTGAGNVSKPGSVSGAAMATTVLSAGFKHACATLSDNRTICWGFNNKAQAGFPTGDGIAVEPLTLNSFKQYYGE